jgi:hypothetical protein
MNIVKTCVFRPFSNTFGFDFGLFYENKDFLEGRNRVKKCPKLMMRLLAHAISIQC